MDGNQYEDERIRPRTNKLTAAEIEKIYKAFIETGGHVCRTAQYTGYAKSTVSRYVKRSGWREELLMQNSVKQPGQQAKMVTAEDAGSGNIEEQIMSKLVTLREMLFEEIIGNGISETADESILKILPRTLAEAVKALVDIDKRIIERVEAQSVDVLDIYQSILTRCARIIED